MKTKKQAREHKYHWNKALLEGRVVRLKDGASMRTFLTKDEAVAFVVKHPGWAELVELSAADRAESERIMSSLGVSR